MELEELKKEINTLKGKITTLESKKQTFEKNCEELIAKTIYSKQQEIENAYGEVLTEAEKRLEANKAEKEKERKENLKELAKLSTKELRDNNVYLDNEIKRQLRENKLPGFINSNFYFCIWNPTNIGETFVGFLVFLAFMIVPTVLLFLIYKDELNKMFTNDIIKILVIVFIYVIYIFILALIWLLIDKITKKKPEIIKEVSTIRKNIKDNERQIRKIERKIYTETDDANFDYTKVDREIEAGKIEVERKKLDKKEAMEKFSSTTQKEIEDKIKKEAMKDISAIEEEIANVKKELDEKQKVYEEEVIKNCETKVNEE